jgi:3-methyl-2-oxobutanoate hydroxymethyltransferase
MRITLRDLQRMKAAGERIAMLTAYDYASALIAERAGVDMILVGDSMGMVMHGHDTTLPVTTDDIVRHAAAVCRGARRALVVGDLPFLTYGTEADALAAARRIMQDGGVQAVKLEGGQAILPAVRHLTALGVPVMGHLGFTPQAQHQLGVRVQAREVGEGRQLLADALALQEAGAFGIVLELVPAPLAAAVTERLRIPTIGIGAGAGCDGEVQVWHDVLGLFESSPRHAKRFAEIGQAMEGALRSYVGEVRAREFPTAKQSARMDEADLAAVLDGTHAA